MFDPNDLDALDRQTLTDWVSISEMFVDTYTRPVSEAKINRMLRSGFDADKLGVIMLSMRADGRFFILDGNHRVQAARKRGHTKMLARVFIDKTREQEAELFVAFNTVNRPTALDRFRARLQMHEPQAAAIQHILGRLGLAVAVDGVGIGKITAVAALDRVYAEQGPSGFTRVVQILHAAWGTERKAWHSQIIDGMRQFWLRYHAEVDVERLITVLRKPANTPERIMGRAGVVMEVRATAGTLVGQRIRLDYNHGLKTRNLPEWIDRPGTNIDGRSRPGPQHEEA